MSEEHSQHDETRLCPTCRMSISVLATRCRYCGESVGRPRKEQKELTIEDLGGESVTQYSMPGSVMDALEAFRTEEMSAAEKAALAKQLKKRSWRGGGRTSSPPREEAIGNAGLPELDAMNRDLSDSVLGTAQAPRPEPARPSFSPALIAQRVLVFAAIVAGLMLTFLGTSYGWARIQDYLERRNAPPEITYDNRAVEMIEQGRPPIEALEEAMTALGLVPSAENEDIAAQVRRTFIAQVRELLKAQPFEHADLAKASALAHQAFRFDTSSEIQDLLQQVDGEVNAHNMVLTSIEEGKATFRLNNPELDMKSQTVAVGDLLQQRFIVRDIGDRQVLLEDTRVESRRGNRKLLAKMMSQVEGV